MSYVIAMQYKTIKHTRLEREDILHLPFTVRQQVNMPRRTNHLVYAIAVSLCCRARAQVYEVPTGGLAVVPEGSTRELEEPFTTISLPKGSENSLAAQNISAAKNASFVSFSQAFSDLLGSDPELEEIAEKDYPFAHEGPVYLPNSNEVSDCLCESYFA